VKNFATDRAVNRARLGASAGLPSTAFFAPIRRTLAVLVLATLAWAQGGPASAGTVTATILDVTPSPSVVNHEVTLTATIMDVSSGALVVASGATGTVTFTASGLGTLGTIPLSGGTATLTHTFLAGDIGVKSVQAAYSGDGSFDGSTSTPVQHQIFAVPANAISSSLNPSGLGQAVTFTSIVGGFGGAPTGTVTFKDGDDTLDTVNVDTVGVGQPLMVGGRYACALSQSRAKCWGSNAGGELGTASNDGFDVAMPPADVTGLSSSTRPVALSGRGGHTCALISDGRVKCWGDNRHAQLGLGFASVYDPGPGVVRSGSILASTGSVTGATAVAAGALFTCILTNAGGVKCWGRNSEGQLGSITGSPPPPFVGAGSLTPVDVSGLTSGVIAIAAGYEHACALTSAGGVKCWGNGDPTVVDVDGLSSGVIAISAGGGDPVPSGHTCAVTGAGGVKCWGDNSFGQLGVADANGMVDGLPSGVVAIAAGARSTCALTSAGGVKCWGNGDPAPVDVPNLTSGVTAIAVGSTQFSNGMDVACAVTSAAAVQCWGDNRAGQLGIDPGSVSSSATPLTIPTMGAGSAMVFGKATYTTSALALGDHSIVATYQTDNPSLEDNTTPALTQTVTKAGQTVNFTSSAPADAKFGGTYNPTATATSGLAVELGASGACSFSGGTVSFDTVGTCTVTADQSGNGTYNAAPQATQVFAIGKADQTVNFTSSAPASPKVGGSYTPTATVTSGLTPSFGASGACSFSGGLVTFTAAGSCTVTADQSGNASYNAAPQATQTFNVAKLDQTVGFTSSTPASPKVGGSYNPVASATSGLAVTFSASGACSFSGSTVSFTATGACTVKANQAGNGTYKAAPEATQPINVGKAMPSLAATAAPTTAKPGQTVKVTLNITAPEGVTPGGSVTFKEGSRSLGTANVSAGKAMLNVPDLTIGAHTITAQYAGDANLAAKSATAIAKVSAAIGPEFKVNVETEDAQQFPSIAKIETGYAVVWASRNQDSSGYGVYGQRYNANGVAQGATDLPISTTPLGNQTLPRVAGLTSGKFVVVWQSDGQDGSGTGIYARSFSATGTGAAEFKVNKTTAGAQAQPVIAALDDGGFVVVWTSNGQDGSSTGVYAQRYNAAATAVGSEFKVNTTTSGAQSAPAVAGLDGGGFVVLWQSADADGLGIFGQRYSATGVVVGKQFAVNKITTGEQSLPSVAGLSGGGFVAVWQSDLQDGDGLGVFARRFDASGKPVGNDVRVNTTTEDDQSQPQVSAFGDGGYAVVWTSQGQDGAGKGVYAQVYDAAGAKVDVEFLVNTRTAKDQWQPAVAAGDAGNFTAVWVSRDQDGSLEGVYGQRFMVPMGD
jgi:alpha-tubulin suppressor-like RCC1 family protein